MILYFLQLFLTQCYASKVFSKTSHECQHNFPKTFVHFLFQHNFLKIVFRDYIVSTYRVLFQYILL